MTFSTWFDEHKDELLELHRTDGLEEAIFKAWLAGMEYGSEYMAELMRPQILSDYKPIDKFRK